MDLQRCTDYSEDSTSESESSFENTSEPDLPSDQHGTTWQIPLEVVPRESVIPPFREQDTSSRTKTQVADSLLNETIVSPSGRESGLDSGKENKTTAKKPSTISSTKTSSSVDDDGEETDSSGKVTTGNPNDKGVKTDSVTEKSRVTDRPSDKSEGLQTDEDIPGRTPGTVVTARPPDGSASGGSDEMPTDEALNNQPTQGSLVSMRIDTGTVNIGFDKSLTELKSERPTGHTEEQGGVEIVSGVPNLSPRDETVTPDVDDIVGPSERVDETEIQETNNNGVLNPPPTDRTRHVDTSPTAQSDRSKTIIQGSVTERPATELTPKDESQPQLTTATRDMGDIVDPSERIGDTENQETDNGVPELAPTDKTKKVDIPAITEPSRTGKTFLQDSVTDTSLKETTPTPETVTRGTHGRVVPSERLDESEDNITKSTPVNQETRTSAIHVETKSGVTAEKPERGGTDLTPRGETLTLDAHGIFTSKESVDTDIRYPSGNVGILVTTKTTETTKSPDINEETHSDRTSKLHDQDHTIRTIITEVTPSGETITRAIPSEQMDLTGNMDSDKDVVNPSPTNKATIEDIGAVTKSTDARTPKQLTNIETVSKPDIHNRIKDTKDPNQQPTLGQIGTESVTGVHVDLEITENANKPLHRGTATSQPAPETDNEVESGNELSSSFSLDLDALFDSFVGGESELPTQSENFKFLQVRG